MKNVKTGHSKPIVVLDAGHFGSKYNRSPVEPDYYESEAMWNLHKYLKTELEAYGIDVRVTRTDKAKDLNLLTRGKMSKGADLFVSLHSNAESTGKADNPLGIYFYDDDCGKIDEQSKAFAELLAGVVADTMGTVKKATIWTRKSGNDRDGDGKLNDDYYGVLFGSHQVGTTGIIIEHSYHTNARAAKWLLNENNLKKLAKAEAKAIAVDWFGMAKKSDTTASSKPVTTKKATDAAKSGPVSSLKGTYKVTASWLNVRNGAGADKDENGNDKHPVMVAIPNGTKVKCYGYYTAVNGVKWLYVQFTYEGTTYTGFASSKHLVKV